MADAVGRMSFARFAESQFTLNVLHQAYRVVDGGVDVAARDGVADAEEAIAPLMVAHDRLRPVREQRVVVDFAEIASSRL